LWLNIHRKESLMSLIKFDQDTAISQVSELVWQADLNIGWCVGPVPNGGYVLAIGAKVLSAALPHKDPLTTSAYYFAPTHAGPIECQVEIIKQSGCTAFGMVRMYQDNALKVQITASFTTLAQMKGESLQLDPAPPVAKLEDCIRVPSPDFVQIARHTIQMVEPGMEQAFLGKPTGEGEFAGWVSLPDTDQTDLFALLMFSDAMPPPIFNIFGALSWVPTIELNVQIRAIPAPGPIQFKFSSRNLTNGLTEENGSLWDSTGKLVAMSRQTAKFRVSKR
jgi:acyl-CoA thioesterase